MRIQYDPLFDDPNIVQYHDEKPDGSSEIIANQVFAQSIIETLTAAHIPCGLDSEQPTVGQCAIITTSSMSKASHVKQCLKQWMISNNVGDLESVQ